MAIIPPESLNDLREMWPTATNCGDTLHYNSDEGLRDECGHAVALAHTKWMDRALRLLAVVSHEHRINPEGLIPTCAGCGQSWPCAIARVLEAE